MLPKQTNRWSWFRSLVALIAFAAFVTTCSDEATDDESEVEPRSGGYAGYWDMLEPPEHAPGEPQASRLSKEMRDWFNRRADNYRFFADNRAP